MAERVLIVGAGMIGTACAYYLSKSGRQVTLIDRGDFGKGCSHANCGFVCPSHILPLAVPGAVGKALKGLFQKNAPLSIKPRLDASLWSWLYHFARCSNERDMLEAGQAIQALLNSSRCLYDRLFQTEAIDAEWETRGLLFVFLSSAAMEHYAATDELLRNKFGLSAKRYDGKPIISQSPALTNVYIAAGHNMLGLSMAPATGKLIAELLSGQSPHISLAPYAATRF